MLEKQSFEKNGVWNDLSDALRKQLQEKVDSLGKTARFKFAIGKENPDPAKHNGPMVYPFIWTLDPVVFDIVEKGVSVKKKIGMYEGTSNDKDDVRPVWKRVRVYEKERGVKTYYLDNPDDVEEVAYLLLHPKLSDGLFSDKRLAQQIELVDEKKYSTEKRKERSEKLVALSAAQEMSDQDVLDFADAMLWDSTQDIEILRGLIEEMAEVSPKMFGDLVKGKRIKYQATIKRALDKQFVNFNPAEYKFNWANGQVLATLLPTEDKNEIEKLAEYFLTGGKKAEEQYKKVEELLK
jgi:hypothetical protein